MRVSQYQDAFICIQISLRDHVTIDVFGCKVFPKTPRTFETRPPIEISPFPWGTIGVTHHKGVVVSSDTVLFVEKAYGLQVGTREFIHSSFGFIRYGRFGSITLAARPPFRHLITSTRGWLLRPLCYQRLLRSLSFFYPLYFSSLLVCGVTLRCLLGRWLRQYTAQEIGETVYEVRFVNIGLQDFRV